MISRFLLSAFFVGSCAAGLFSCQNHPANRAALEAEPRVIRETMSSYIEVGEQRSFSGRGPQYKLPSSYYEFARAHPIVAIDLLKAKLQAEKLNYVFNAYDFLAHMVDVPEVREEVIRIIRKGAQTEGYAVRQFLAPVIERLDAQEAATRSTKGKG